MKVLGNILKAMMIAGLLLTTSANAGVPGKTRVDAKQPLSTSPIPARARVIVRSEPIGGGKCKLHYQGGGTAIVACKTKK